MVTLVEPQNNINEVYFHNNFVNNLYGTNYMNRRKNLIMCANCGGLGHVYRTCNHPTISYGVICYSFREGKVVYLMVQRKDSLSYVEFMRGKYNLENKKYLMKLFSYMTNDERLRLQNNDFDHLWRDMWCKNETDGKHFNKEYQEAAEKFNKIKTGYLMKSQENEVISININYLVSNTKPLFSETEWGFPKGRRNVNENDLNCALREFKEETGLNTNIMRLLFDLKPLEEVFSGTNKKRYKHVYYIAQLCNNISIDIIDDQSPCREIKAVKWFTYEECQTQIRDINVERKELLKRLNNIILKH
jgi:8-oxo-dGTP pyrophosphatase MutT (NUDIX family)